MYWLCAVFVAGLANWAAIETWHHGKIFLRPRAWLEVREGFFPDLLACPFCLSHWTALPITCLLILAETGPEPSWRWLVTPVMSLAATRLSNLFNDLGRATCRTPHRHDADVAALAALAEGALGGSSTGEAPGTHHPSGDGSGAVDPQ